MCLGRPASGEQFDRGLWQQGSEVWRDDSLLWCEHSHVPGDSPLLASPRAWVATACWLPCCGPDRHCPELHQACLELPCAGRAAASQLPGIWLARFIGDSAEAAHHWLRSCRDLIYPFSHGRAASQPRIWAS
jgi:urease accessory protein